MTGCNGFVFVQEKRIRLFEPFGSMALPERYRISRTFGPTTTLVAILPLAVLRAPNSSGGSPIPSLLSRRRPGRSQTIARTDRKDQHLGKGPANGMFSDERGAVNDPG